MGDPYQRRGDPYSRDGRGDPYSRDGQQQQGRSGDDRRPDDRRDGGRGGGEERRDDRRSGGGPDDRRGGYDDRRDERRGGYDDRRQGGGHDDRRGGYDDRRQGGGYDDRRQGGGGYGGGGGPPRDDRRGGGYDDRRGGGYDDRRGGGGGGGRGFGGGGGRGGGRGGGGGGGGSQGKFVEAEAIKVFSSNALPPRVKMISNHFPIDLVSKPLYKFAVSFQFGENAEDVKGDSWKTEVAESYLKQIIAPRNTEVTSERKVLLETIINLGNIVISHTPIAKELLVEKAIHLWEGSKKKRVRRSFTVSMAAIDEGIDLTKTKDSIVLNTIIQKAATLVFPTRMGSKFLDVSHPEEHGSIVVFRGMSIGVHEVTGDDKTHPLEMVVNPECRVASNQTAQSVVDGIFRQVGGDKAGKLIAERLKGKRVVTLYGSQHPTANRAYKLIEWKPTITPGDTMDPSKEKPDTYAQYFKTKYNITLQDSTIFFSAREVGKTGRPVNLPLQVVKLMEVSEEDKSRLPQICGLYPQERMQRIQTLLKQINDHPHAKNLLDNYGLKFSTSPIETTGAVCRPPIITLAGGARVNPQDPDNTGQMGFARSLQRIRHTGPTVPTQIVNVVSQRDEGSRSGMFREVISTLNAMNSAFKPDTTGAKIPIERGNADLALADLQVKGFKTDGVFVVNFPRKETGPYNAVKSVALKQGLLTQVVAKDHTSPVAFKMIAQQISAKSGNLNWNFNIRDVCPSIGATHSTMIVGIDVASDVRQYGTATVTKEARLFVAAYVAFFATADGQWKHFCGHHVSRGGVTTVYREENADGADGTETTASSNSVNRANVGGQRLTQFLDEAIKFFGQDPNHLVIARGSVSEGEINEVRRVELEPVQEWLRPKSIQLTYLAAQKRCSTRLFCDMERVAPQHAAQFNKALVNVPRGFVTREGIPVIKISDKSVENIPGFFLVSASCTLGHAKPIQFLNLTGDSAILELPELFYALAFCFPNKPDAIPYPLPLKCAEKYANQFILLELEGGLESLKPALAPRMHYL